MSPESPASAPEETNPRPQSCGHPQLWPLPGGISTALGHQLLQEPPGRGPRGPPDAHLSPAGGAGAVPGPLPGQPAPCPLVAQRPPFWKLPVAHPITASSLTVPCPLLPEHTGTQHSIRWGCQPWGNHWLILEEAMEAERNFEIVQATPSPLPLLRPIAQMGKRRPKKGLAQGCTGNPGAVPSTWWLPCSAPLQLSRDFGGLWGSEEGSCQVRSRRRCPYSPTQTPDTPASELSATPAHSQEEQEESPN